MRGEESGGRVCSASNLCSWPTPVKDGTAEVSTRQEVPRSSLLFLLFSLAVFL